MTTELETEENIDCVADLPAANVFSVDVEDYFQVSAFDGSISRDAWGGFESRVEASTRRILALLQRHDVKATFFVLGWVAERFPQLVQDIDDAGHEIGSHTYWHRLIYEQTPNEFREDLRRSRDVLQTITGKPVTCFRAPSFSIVKRSLWALEILVEEGFTADSSIVPTRHDRYGIPGAKREIHQLETPSGTICEFPPTVVHLAGNALPVGGGGYFRLYPYHLTRRWLTKAQRQVRQPFMFYIHPWEVDPKQPVLSAGTRLAQFRHRVGLPRTEVRLERLLEHFPFDTMSNALHTHRGLAT